jgi:hypothetical protein
MNSPCRLVAELWVAVIVTAATLSACAPEAAVGAEHSAPAAAKKPAAKAAPGPAQSAAKEESPPPETPAVAAILGNHPSTPAECAQAAKILADLGRLDLSKQFLKRVLDAKPDEKTLADLAEQLGAATFLGMAERPELLPEAKQLADAVLAAANRRLQDPQRLTGLIDQLRDPSPDVRDRARAGLADAHGAAVGPLIAVLADASRAAEHAQVRAALGPMESDAVAPLLGMLQKPDAQTVVQAIQVLAAMDSAKVTIYLLRPALAEKIDPRVRAAAVAALQRRFSEVPSKTEAVRMLLERARNYFDRRQSVEGEVAGQVKLWDWDAATKRPLAKSYAADDAARVLAARLARDAYAILPDDHQVRLLYLATMLEQAAYENGLDKPLEDRPGSPVREAAGFGAATMQGVLEYAMAGHHPAAATAAAQILGRCGQAGEILYRGPSPTPLVMAARSPDRRLRLAACEAIVQLKPNRPFAGASYVPETLAMLAASRGAGRALVGSPSIEGARELAGMMASSGLQVDTASTGRELVHVAAASPDYELALIDSIIDRPTVDLVVQELRGDYRTADLRVGLIARSGNYERAERIAREQPLTLAFSRPHDEQSFQWQMGQLAALGPRAFVGHAERQRQAALALDLLAALSVAPQGIYDLRRMEDSVLTALYNPALSTKAAAVLANLGTPESQRALVDTASRSGLPLEVRKAAVEAFRRNSQKHGILLTTGEIRRQYDRYNNSRSLDAAAQQVLGLILDCIEAPTKPVNAPKKNA